MSDHLTIAQNLKKGADVIKNTIKNLPDKPGVYRMLDKDDHVLYVGKAKNLPKRLFSYTQVQKLPLRLQRMVSATTHLEIVTTITELEALLLENNLIKKFKPHYNILLKDDKSYPYIYLTDHDFPQIIKYRGLKNKKGLYFGPFANVAAVDEVILTIQRIFMMRNCNDTIFKNRNRPCLQYHIKRCSAPCVGKITPDAYQKNLSDAEKFLKGKTEIVQQSLSAQMQIHSDEMNYERAAIFRDRLKLLASIQNKQRVEIKDINDADVIALHHTNAHSLIQIFFYRYGKNFGTESIFLTHTKDQKAGDCMGAFLKQFYLNHEPPNHIIINQEPSDFSLIKESLQYHYKQNIKWEMPKSGVKKDLINDAYRNAKQTLDLKISSNAAMDKILSRLKDIFHLPMIPTRIEAYDNSHIQGSNPVGVMVVANQDGMDKKAYRKFSIKQKRAFGGDDFAMMKEVLERRFKHAKEWGMPDLLLIDGGIGQVNIAYKVLKDLDIKISVVGMAKGEDRNAGRETFIVEGIAPFQLEKNDPLLHFLQRIRDESHRFAITTHRKKRIKNIEISTLDDIPDIGPTRKKSLLQHFGSVTCVKEASLKELTQVSGISDIVAKKIYNFFHEV